MASDYVYRISPEVIQGDIFTVYYSGNPVGVYSGMTQVLSGGPGGTSLLTGLTIYIWTLSRKMPMIDCTLFTPNFEPRAT